MLDDNTTDEFDTEEFLMDFDPQLEADLDLDLTLDDLLLELDEKTPSDLEVDAQAGAGAADDSERIRPTELDAAPDERLIQEHSEESHHHHHHHHSEPERKGFLGWVARHRFGINLLLILIALTLAGAIAALFYFRENADPYNWKILSNVSIAGVDVGAMTKGEAADAIRQAIGSDYGSQDMIVVMGSEEIVLPASGTRAALNAEAAAEAAYAYGREGTAAQMHQAYLNTKEETVNVPLDSCLELDKDFIRDTLKKAADSMSGTFTPSGYALEGEMPALDADNFDASAPCQTLTLTVGVPGSGYDLDGIVDAVVEAFGRSEFRLEIGREYLPDCPEALDADAIYAEICIEPVEAVEDPTTKAVTPGSCGYRFPLEEARAKLAAAQFGDVISIPMEYVEPERLDIRGEFPQLLAVYSTELSENEDYNHNMALFCEAINGTVLDPGATVSLKEAFPAVKAENGFRSAPVHDSYCTTEEIGGGMDQVATTLHVAAMSADLAIAQRNSTDHICGYTMPGTEVSIDPSWKDLKIRNSFKTPVQIRARVSGSKLTVQILGQEELDYYCAVEYKQVAAAKFTDQAVFVSSGAGYTNDQVIREGIDGGSYQLYRVKYDKATNAELSRTNEAYVSLQPVKRLIAKIG